MAAKRKPPKAAAQSKAPWERDQLSVRLTEARRACLRLISDAMPAHATPNDAVDRAIEIALSKAEPAPERAIDLGARLDDLEELVARMGREREADAAKQRGVADETLREARSISALISAVAAMPSEAADDEGGWGDRGDMGAASEAVPSLRAWLDARAGAASAVSCVARWRSKSRLGDRLVAMEFDIEMPGRGGGRSVVRIEPLDSASPMASVDQVGALSLSCRRVQGGGWEAMASRLNPDRSAGPPLAQLRV
jgi:hypothetical protein